MTAPLNTQGAEALLHGAYDLHIHAAPSPFGRACDEYQLLEEAGRAGMAGIVLKSHYEPTAARASLANEHCATCTKAYGSIVLNHPVGGLNPFAVENALIRGARIVWMPTRDSAHSLLEGDMPGDFFERDGIRIVDEDGALLPVVYEIFRIVKKYDAALATGHLSPEESKKLCAAGRKEGVRMVLTHPEFNRTVLSAEEQKAMADEGVFVEHCWYNIAEHQCSAEDMASHIRAAGVEQCFLSTDRGQAGYEHPVEAMAYFIETMLKTGFSDEEIRIMTRDVPKKVLGL